MPRPQVNQDHPIRSQHTQGHTQETVNNSFRKRFPRKASFFSLQTNEQHLLVVTILRRQAGYHVPSTVEVMGKRFPELGISVRGSVCILMLQLYVMMVQNT